MATAITFNSVAYSVPAYGDTGYAQGPGNLSSYLIALSTGTLQQSGGTFSLTSDVNFGLNFGLISKYFTSVTANPATAGTIRLAKTDTIDWRNNANSANLALGINGSDQLTYNGAIVLTGSSGGFVSSITGTANQIIASSPTGAVTLSTPQNIGTTSTVTFGQIIDSGLTANTALTANGSKQLTSSATTSTELGFVSGVTSSIQTQLNGKQPSGTYVTSITGTADEIIVGGTPTVPVLSTPQAIATTSSPTFSNITLSGNGSSNAVLNLLNSTFPGVSFNHDGAGFSTLLTNQTDPVAARFVFIPDSGTTNSNIILSEGAQTINGVKTFGTPIAVGSGGTGNSTFTAYSIIAAGTTATGPFQNVSGVGTSGQVLTSNGAATLPTWQNVAGTGTVNTGTATHLAYYATSTNAVSDANGATVSGAYTFSGVHTFSAQDVHSAGISITGVTSNNTIDTTQNLGATLNANFVNSNATAAGNSKITIAVDPSGGDAYVNYLLTGSNQWSLGLDNSNNDAFTLTNGADPSSGTAIFTIPRTTGVVDFSSSPTVPVATTATQAPRFSQIKLLQVVTATSTTAFTTTSSTFQASNLTASITPTSASNRIKITASGPIQLGANNHNVFITLERGTTNLGAANGFQQLSTTTGGGVNVPSTMTFIDSPATTSATSYTVYIKNDDNATSVVYGVGSLTQTIILEEIV